MEEDVKTPGDYLAALRRRKGQLMGVLLFILVASTAVAVGLPSVYRSSGTILIEQQEIPPDLVRSTITSFADQRIQVIGQRVMTTSNLLDIIKKYDLYAEDRKTQPTEVVVDEMRDDIKVDMVSADVVDQRTGRPTQATIAFTVSYDNESPTLAQKVANELVSLYLNENLKNRTQLATEAASFLQDESKRLSAKLGELEKALATFKEKNADKLPELTQLNMQLMDRADRDLVDVKHQIESLEDRKIYLEAQLAQLNPLENMVSDTGQRILGPADRLKSLRAQYVSMAAVYAPDYPDLVKMRKEIQGLEAEVGGGKDVSDMAKRLESLRAELATTTKKYSPDHPDVKKLRREVASLEKEIDQAGQGSKKGLSPGVEPDNPAYIQIQSQLASADADLKAQRAKEADLKAKLASFEENLSQVPQVEREYRELMREHDTTQAKYQDIQAKQLEAQLGKTLETERKGERFTLIEPPLLPEEPVKPNRLAIMFLGVVLSFAGGVGTAAVAETLDTTVRGTKGVTRLVGAAPLAAIPAIETPADLGRRRRRRIVIVVSIVSVLLVALVLFHLFVRPLDVLWYVALRHFGM